MPGLPDRLKIVCISLSGIIYGDGITLERAVAICVRLKAKGFASTNVVLGIGSFTYQYNTRDTFGFAMKATYGEVNGVGRPIFKNPVTDDGTQKSAKGLRKVAEVGNSYILKDDVSWEEEQTGAGSIPGWKTAYRSHTGGGTEKTPVSVKAEEAVADTLYLALQPLLFMFN